MKPEGSYTINGKASDIGLYDHLFDGTDDEHDELLKKEKLLKEIREELARRWYNKVKYDVFITGIEEDMSKFGSDRDIVLAAVSKYGDALEYADQSLKNDKKIVLAAVAQDGYALRYASKNLRADEVVVATAINQKKGATKFSLIKKTDVK